MDFVYTLTDVLSTSVFICFYTSVPLIVVEQLILKMVILSDIIKNNAVLLRISMNILLCDIWEKVCY